VTGRCSLCRSTGEVECHHVTGREVPGGDYLDPDLVLPLCPPCHTGRAGIHPALRAAGLDFPAFGDDLHAFRLRRLGVTYRLIAGMGHGPGRDAMSTRAVADLMCEAADVLARGMSLR